MSRKLVKTRNSRIDTVNVLSTCSHNCSNCSGGGSWSVSEGSYKVKNI